MQQRKDLNYRRRKARCLIIYNELIKWSVLPLVIAFIIGLMLFEMVFELGKLIQTRLLSKVDHYISGAFDQLFDW